MGIMGHFLIVGRVALAAIHRRLDAFFMVLLSRLGVADQTLNAAVPGFGLISGHLFMAFHALIVCINIP